MEEKINGFKKQREGKTTFDIEVRYARGTDIFGLDYTLFVYVINRIDLNSKNKIINVVPVAHHKTLLDAVKELRNRFVFSDCEKYIDTWEVIEAIEKTNKKITQLIKDLEINLIDKLKKGKIKKTTLKKLEHSLFDGLEQIEGNEAEASNASTRSAIECLQDTRSEIQHKLKRIKRAK